jgi:hypothetical protein
MKLPTPCFAVADQWGRGYAGSPVTSNCESDPEKQY